MSVSVTRQELNRFRCAIAGLTGLHFDDGKLAFLEQVLRHRVGRAATSTASYLVRLEQDPPRDEMAALAQDLTVNESYFFRHYDQFRAFAEVALPERMRIRDSARTLSLLSAGCASGEEAYSLAIVTQELVDPSWAVSIQAIDLNPAVLRKAAQGRYSEWALRETPPEMRRNWFHTDRRELVLADSVRNAVQFSIGNLASDNSALWQPATYDVVFCRNVLMYFSPEQMRAAIGRLAASLSPGGYLFLGHAETLRGISDDFHLCHTHETFYYRRRNSVAPAFRQRTREPASSTVRSARTTSPLSISTAWADAIREANERVSALMSAPHVRNPAALQKSRRWQLAPALDLLRRERFNEALDQVRTAPPENEGDTDVLLVKAVLLAQDGQLAAAEETCQRLLLTDGLNAGAHYVLALCREHAGEWARAMEHDRFAVHLDPTFAMPRLHRGLLARQTGDRDSARRKLAQALLLLKREDVSRLLLFGGGFSRDALIALCQAAVAECGRRP